jgi:hypothetical protein
MLTVPAVAVAPDDFDGAHVTPAIVPEIVHTIKPSDASPSK